MSFLKRIFNANEKKPTTNAVYTPSNLMAVFGVIEDFSRLIYKDYCVMKGKEEINQKIKNRISELINKKMAAKKRPNNTALLVFFDDYTTFRYDLDESKPEMDTFLNLINILWQRRYLALYVVGASGQSFYEKPPATKNLQN